MPTAMERAASAQAAAITRFCGRAVDYSRGDVTAQWRARRTRPQFMAELFGGIVGQSEAWDWIGLPGDLILPTGETLPEPGDQIRELDDSGRTTNYEVMALTAGGLAYELDADRTRLRIHSRLIARE